VSEQWEFAQERQPPSPGGKLYHPTPEDLLVRYVKLLVWRTFKLRVCHLAVGLGCHLYQYLPDDIETLAAVFSNANIRRVNGYRLDEIRARFPDLDLVTIPPYGAIKVRTRTPDRHERALVLEALAAFTPWDTPHTPPSQSVQQLFDAGHPGLEWQQKHALIDVGCAGLERLIRAYNQAVQGSTMRLTHPADMLGIPAFAHAGNASGGHRPPTAGGKRFHPTPLCRAAIRVMQHALERQRRRRRHHRSGRLSVHVDGQERAQLTPETKACAPFQVPLGACMVEVFGNDEDGTLLLAAFPLPMLELIEDDHVRLVVTHEGGSPLEFVIQPVRDETGEVLAGRVHVVALEAPRGLTAVLGERLWPLWEAFGRLWWAAPWPRPVVAGALLLVLSSLSLFFIHTTQQVPRLEFRGTPHEASQPQGPSEDCSQAQTYVTQAGQVAPHPTAREALIAQERLYHQAIALCPSYAEAHNNLGHVYEQLGRYAEAIKAYTQAKELRSDLPYPYFGLGDVYFKRGDYQEAIKWYDAGLAHDPTDEGAQAFRQQAEALWQHRVRLEAQIASDIVSVAKEPTQAAKSPVRLGLILFAPATADLREDAEAQLDAVESVLVVSARLDYVFEIGGHTDHRGSAAEALTLSLRRAEAVKAYLMTHFQIPGDRLQAKGYGADHLIALGNDEASRALNNRVEIVGVGKSGP
jgi:outer membrane protein OmpA-like peptidoglycan-associated protein